jgi:RsmE family RNA methyltransferase
MQSRRVYLPEVTPLFEFAEMLGSLPAGRAAMAQPGGRPISLDMPTVLVGPEGGWEPAELEVGLPTVALGPTRLRAETAAIVAGALLCALRSGLVAPRPPHAHPSRPTPEA